MNLAELRQPTLRRIRSRAAFAFLAVAGFGIEPLVAATADSVPAKDTAAEDVDLPDDDVISLAAYNVKADRIEDFGVRVEAETYSGKQANLATLWFSTFAPRISSVLPNSAAAKAGLQPGERILKSEGQSTVGGLFSTGKFGQWNKTQKKKWAEVAAGKTNVTWTLEVETPATKAVRTVKLVVPTPPPYWGGSVWRAPERRAPATVPETGPLADRCRAVLDHGIWTMVAPGLVAPEFLQTVFGEKIPPALSPQGFTWDVGNRRQGSHRIIVTQFRGKTEVLLSTSSPLSGPRFYLTSPSGVLVKAWEWRRGKAAEIPAPEARVGFEHEVDLWANKVGKVSARWPFELKPGYDADAIFTLLAPRNTPQSKAALPPMAEEFLKLRPATETEKALFADAYSKLGADPENWAYTESAHGIDDPRVLVTRFDPSKNELNRCVLLSVDGHPATSAEIEQWRAGGGDVPKPLGDLPPLTSIVDWKDLRIFAENSTGTVFELPIRNGTSEFPAEKFLAHFRVNSTSRAFDSITVKLRESFRVGGVVKVMDAGMELRFQMLDPALPPQPVYLKAGGGVRVLLMNFARSFEATRTDFVRVAPF